MMGQGESVQTGYRIKGDPAGAVEKSAKEAESRPYKAVHWTRSETALFSQQRSVAEHRRRTRVPKRSSVGPNA